MLNYSRVLFEIVGVIWHLNLRMLLPAVWATCSLLTSVKSVKNRERNEYLQCAAWSVTANEACTAYRGYVGSRPPFPSVHLRQYDGRHSQSVALLRTANNVPADRTSSDPRSIAAERRQTFSAETHHQLRSGLTRPSSDSIVDSRRAHWTYIRLMTVPIILPADVSTAHASK